MQTPPVTGVKDSTRKTRQAFALLATCLATSLASVFFLPIYTDELAYKFLQGRLFADGGIVSLSPHCRTGYELPIPFLQWPFRVIDGWLYSGMEHPLRIRVVGLLIGVALIALLFRAIDRLLRYPYPRDSFLRPELGAARAARLFLWSLLGCGLLPWILAFNRPEQMLSVFFAGLALSVARWADAPAPRERLLASPWTRDALPAFTVSFLSVGALAYHPKVLLFVPFLLWAAWRCVRSREGRAAAFTLIAVAAWQAYDFQKRRGACPESSMTMYKASHFAVDPSLLWRDPGAFWTEVRRNLGLLRLYFTSVTFSDAPTSQWLPWTRPTLDAFAQVANFFFKPILLALQLLLAFSTVRSVAQLRAGGRERVLAEAFLTLGLGAFGLGALQSHRHFYEASFVYPLMLLALAFAAPLWARSRRVTGVLAVLALTLAALSSLRHVATSARYFSEWTRGGDLPAQPYSFSAFHFAGVRDEVKAAAAMCGISEASVSPAVDDVTLPVFWRNRRPVPLLNVTGHWGDLGGRTLAELLVSIGGSGVIARCPGAERSMQDGIPEALQAYVRRTGNFCCVSADDLRAASLEKGAH